MARLQLLALIENIPLNIKNSIRCAKKCFFNLWRRQLGPALADAGPNARLRRGAPLSSVL